MRTFLPLGLLALLALGVVRLAHAEEPAPQPVDPLAAKVATLERQTAYLAAREARLTAYVLRHGERADALKRLAADLRLAGFTAAANPGPARERLLQGLEALADGLKKDLPDVTKEETSLLTNGR